MFSPRWSLPSSKMTCLRQLAALSTLNHKETVRRPWIPRSAAEKLGMTTMSFLPSSRTALPLCPADTNAAPPESVAVWVVP